MENILDYDIYIVAWSGGKDSLACFLRLLELGVPKEKIELWHHDIDGNAEQFMDWECTPAYCEAVAKAFGVKYYRSYKIGGFKREMLRDNSATAPIVFQVPKEEWSNTMLKRKLDTRGYYIVTGGNGPLNTRLKFPQVSADLKVRWCSAYLKIDVCATAIRNQERFSRLRVRTLVISGERAEESPNRSRYAELEPDRADNRTGRVPRYVDRCRLVKNWTEKEVWEIIERFLVRAHPAYYIGWGRVSCKWCIFGNANQTCSANRLSPEQGQGIIQLEKQFNHTIKRNKSVADLIAAGTPYEAIESMNEQAIAAISTEYNLPIIMEPGTWVLPAGAFGESCGPV